MRWTVGTAVMLCGLYYALSLGLGAARAEAPGIPPETVADFIHAVIESDRTFYTVHVVERLEKQGGMKAAETWRADKTSLPLPVQFLHEASALARMTGTKVRYRLLSLWPINPDNAPENEGEKTGLEMVRQHPERAFTKTVSIGEQPYFQAIYADRAVTQACINCHNTHQGSPKKDFRINDVMGGLVIEVPLGQAR